MNKKLYLVIALTFAAHTVLLSQSVLNPSDTMVNYDGFNEPNQPTYGQIGKWCRTKSLSWNTDSFKAYIYEGSAFRLRFPKSYNPNANDGKKYPVLIVFHGGGETGPITDNETQLYNGAPILSGYADNGLYNGYILFMQSQGKWGQGQYLQLTQICNYMVTNNKLDPFKINISGLSAGGQAAWEMAMDYLSYVSCSLPMSYNSIGYTNSSIINQLKFLPMWYFQGGLDGSPAPYTSDQVDSSMVHAGANYTYTVYPDKGHGVWNAAFTEPNFLPFIANAYPSNPWTLYGRTGFCPGTNINVTIGLSPGYTAYQWRRNGVIISSATTNTITVSDTATYDARVERGTTWSDWSHVPVHTAFKGPTATPPISIAGLMSDVLPGADGLNYVNLQIANTTYTSYTWKKLGSDSIIGTQRILRVNQPGSYIASVTELYGCGSTYSPPFTVFSANGNAPPSAATNLVATPLSNTVMELDWSENPHPINPETAFEVYRGAQSGGPYTFAGQVLNNVDIFKDSSLAPNNTYYYVIRAVNTTGAAPLSNQASATTTSDKTPPTAPKNLTLLFTTRNSISVSWDSSIDNIGVVGYDVYVNGAKTTSTTKTSSVINGLSPYQTYTVYVKAKDAAGNNSVQSNSVTGYTASTGLSYKYYQGDWTALPDFNTLTPVSTGMSAFPDLSVKQRTFQIGFLWQGYIRIPVAGTYTFGTQSNDGSDLWLSPYNASIPPLVNNDGIHYSTYKEGAPVTLTPGIYPISIDFFQVSGTSSIKIFWKCKALFGNNMKVEIDPKYYGLDSTSFTGAVPKTPGGPTLGVVNYSTIKVSWIDSSSNETNFEIYRSDKNSNNFNIVGTVGANITQFTDTTLTASTNYYYKVRAINNYGPSAYTATVLAQTQAYPAKPLAATNLLATTLSASGISLSWQNNNTSNVTGLTIYRSIGNLNGFRLIANISPTTTSFIDTGLFANVLYFYKVYTNGIGGTTTPSTFAKTTTLDVAPNMTNLDTVKVPYGVISNIPLTATDPNGDSLSFLLNTAPSFVSLVDNKNRTATLVLNPASSNQGIYSGNKIIVKDQHGSSDTTIFTIVVNNIYTPTIDSIANYTLNENDSVAITITGHDMNVNGNTMNWSVSNVPNAYSLASPTNGTAVLKLHPNFAAAGIYNVNVTVTDSNGATASRQFVLTVLNKNPSPTVDIRFKNVDTIGMPWNSVVGDTSKGFYDITGSSTNIGLALQTSWFGTFNQGPSTGNNSGVYPDAVLKDYYYFGYNGGPSSVTAKVTGLDTSTVYNLTFYAGSNFSGVTNNGNTNYTIGKQMVTLAVQNNTQNTVSINSVKPASDGTITFIMTKAANAAVGYINALVITGFYDDGTVPLTPLSLTAQAALGAVKLTWQDVAYNESGFQIYRSTNSSGPYSLIKTIAVPNTQVYYDSTVSGFTNYYYEVKAYNSHGTSGLSNMASVVSGDRIPVIQPVSNVVLKNNQTLVIPISAADDSNDRIKFTVTNLPTFATLVDSGNHNGSISIIPNGTIGSFSNVTVTATDSSGASSSTTFDIIVVDANAPSVYLNFTAAPTLADKPWNNLVGSTNAGTTYTNLVDDSNNPTTLAVNLLDGFLGLTNNGMRQGNGKGAYSDSVMRYALYDTSSAGKRIVVSGLNTAQKYNFVFFNSYNAGTSCLTNFTINGQTVSLEGMYNISNTVQINGIAPDSTGKVTITVARASGAVYALLNSLVVQGYDSTIFLSPTDLKVLNTTTNTATLKWSDRSFNESGFELWRANDSGGTFSLLKTFPPNITSYKDSNLATNRTYYYTIRALKTVSGTTTYSSYSNIAAAHTYSYSVYMNFTFDDDSPAPWNNTNSLPSNGLVVSNMLDANSFPSGMNMSNVGTFDGLFTGGMTTGNNSGIFPDSVMLDSYGLFAGNSAVIQITGLNYGLKYDFTFFASANLSGDVNSIYSIGSQSAILNASYNTTGTVSIYNVVPDSTGTATITIAPNSSTSQYGLIGALIVQGFTPSSSSAPALPSGLPRKNLNKNATTEKLAAPVTTTTGANISAYPNPFDQYFTLNIPSKNNNENAEVMIYNAQGKLCYANKFEDLNEGNNTEKINSPQTLGSPGMYIVKIVYEKSGETQTIKLIKLR